MICAKHQSNYVLFMKILKTEFILLAMKNLKHQTIHSIFAGTEQR